MDVYHECELTLDSSQLEVDDFERDWTWKQPFDFIHARTISQSVSNWPHLLEQAFW